ncbi:hypothetical protein TLA_TLA_00512 [Tessaracoccus lapidicaptus]|nr:hypothetical protein TLA_TLA_00512 [Tessaracoccus lapidicaptus]
MTISDRRFGHGSTPAASASRLARTAPPSGGTSANETGTTSASEPPSTTRRRTPPSVPWTGLGSEWGCYSCWGRVDRRLRRRLRDSPGRLRRRARPQRTSGRDLGERVNPQHDTPSNSTLSALDRRRVRVGLLFVLGSGGSTPSASASRLARTAPPSGATSANGKASASRLARTAPPSGATSANESTPSTTRRRTPPSRPHAGAGPEGGCYSCWGRVDRRLRRRLRDSPGRLRRRARPQPTRQDRDPSEWLASASRPIMNPRMA